MDTIHLHDLRDRLTRRRNELLYKLRDSDSRTKAIEEKRWEDRDTRKRVIALANFLRRRRQQELSQIDSALERILQNKYGVCMGCGAPIEIAWLETFPESACCTVCEPTWERAHRG